MIIHAAALHLVASLSLLAARDPVAGGIRLTLQNGLPFERAAEGVTCGVPLPKGFAASASDLALLDAAGKALPCQVEVTGAYGDGTPRWVLLDFDADLPGQGEAVYRLVRGGGRPAPARSVTCRLDGGVAEVDTGAASFRIDTRRFRLFDSVKVGGVELIDGKADRAGILLEDERGTAFAADATPATAAFEETGPLRAVLCVRGVIGPRPGTTPLGTYVCRIHFRAAKAEARVFFTLRNPAAHNHPGNIWDLGSGGSTFAEDVSIVVPLLAGEAARARIAGPEPVTVEDAAAGPVRLYQDSSGGENWRSANHIDKDYKVPLTFRGYRVLRGDAILREGSRIDGWLAARGPAGGAAVAVREFWQNFPKALSLEGGRLRVGLWPREFSGVHEILGGEQKTHEILFLFHEPSADADAGDRAEERRLRAFHRPLYAMLDPASVLATRAFGPTAPLDRERFGRLEETCDTALRPRGGSPRTIVARWEDIDEFGWRHFGDTFADNERAPEAMVRDFPEHHPGGEPISHYVNEYDVIQAVMVQGIRRADPEWMWLADVCARHHADICVNHTDEDAPAYAHGPFMHTTHDTAAYRSTHCAYPIEAKRYGLRYGQGGGPNAGHTYVACLAQHYWLTGDRTSRDAFLEVAGWAADGPWFSKDMMGDERGYGNLLETLVYAYQLTGDRKYHDRAMTLIRWIEKPFAGLGGNLLVKAAGRFLDMKADRGEDDADARAVRDLLMAFGERYLELPAGEWEGFLEQRCFHVEVLSTCYLHAPPDHPKREAFRALGTRILDEALERFPGRYVPTKTWVMCFANVGAYLRVRRAGR